jgi:hypothetical protein
MKKLKITRKQKKEWIAYRVLEAMVSPGEKPLFGYSSYFDYLFEKADKKYILEKMQKDNLTFDQFMIIEKKRDEEFKRISREFSLRCQ